MTQPFAVEGRRPLDLRTQLDSERAADGPKCGRPHPSVPGVTCDRLADHLTTGLLARESCAAEEIWHPDDKVPTWATWQTPPQGQEPAPAG